jgi:hypothetical protein
MTALPESAGHGKWSGEEVDESVSITAIFSITKRFQIIGAAEALSLVECDREVYRHRLQTLRTRGLKA